MDLATAIVWVIIIVLGSIVVQYLFNPYFHRFGLPKNESSEENEKTEEERKKEEEFYRQIWKGRKKS
ncbi:hypothetical protein AciM339_1538 [Aciduliprofundum sp. MAR08-339]|uniref:hypothetical protein n=1 Tax=Aciduliprofundum sp. (strain MAR08-339) TaxID=673860 RepID=UPI0002A4C0C0|nr:hypothetical protein AciM339_1538 [Aciduliprofundum sp. MAR08-339]